MNDANELIFDLRISAEEYLRYYRGSASSVVVRARNGKTVRFPAAVLRSHVDQGGIHGSFVLRYDQRNRLISLERISAGS